MQTVEFLEDLKKWIYINTGVEVLSCTMPTEMYANLLSELKGISLTNEQHNINELYGTKIYFTSKPEISFGLKLRTINMGLTVEK